MTAAAERSATDPRLLAAMQGLELSARRLVAGVVPGLHASRQPGQSREFSQYRAYQPGDEPRQIDWKLFARSDRYFLREGEISMRLRLHLVLDATASMQHAGSTPGAPSKFVVAQRLAAALALLAGSQGDGVELHVVSAGRVTSQLPGRSGQPFTRIVRALAAAEPAGQWLASPAPLTAALRRGGAGASGGASATVDLTVVLTDGFEGGGEIRAALAPLRSLRHEVVFCHILTRDELEFPYRGPARFEDWETGQVIEADAALVRAAYVEGQEREREAWKTAWGGDRFDYLRVITDEPIDRVLRTYLKRRRQA
ncbi:MAG TPA: DUF58 domain-containing protein [Opitutaceae bacterium]